VVDLKTVERVACLARIFLSEQEKQQMGEDLGRILGFEQSLEDAVISEQAGSVIPLPCPLRADKVTQGDERDTILENAPKQERHMFVVPKVV